MKKDVRLIELLKDPLLRKYCPSERRAIFVHKYFLGLAKGHDPNLEEAIESWNIRVASGWRREKMKKDAEAQLVEIEKHKYFMSQHMGYDIGWVVAAHDWINKHAAAWRRWWEEQPESGA